MSMSVALALIAERSSARAMPSPCRLKPEPELAVTSVGSCNCTRFEDSEAEGHGDALTLHSFYVRYLLPMMIEIQFFDWDPAVAALNPGNPVSPR